MTTELTMNIKGEYMRAIINGGKDVEYRAIKPYWDVRIGKCEAPFLMRLINGMKAEAPEIIVEVIKVTKDKKPFGGHPKGVYCLHLGKVKSRKNIPLW